MQRGRSLCSWTPCKPLGGWVLRAFPGAGQGADTTRIFRPIKNASAPSPVPLPSLSLVPIALTFTRIRSLLLALPLLAPPAVGAQAGSRAPDAASIRSAARTYRAANESAILHEFSDFLAIPT